MSEPSQIESRLHVEAEKQLNAELDASVEPFMKIAREGSASLYQIDMLHNGSKVNGYGVINALKAHVFAQLIEARRRKAVDAFMEQVTRLAQDVEELKNSLPQ